MGSEGDARASATTVASLAIGPKNAAPPRKTRRRAQGHRPRRHWARPPSPKTNQWARQMSYTTSREMDSGWPLMRASIAPTSSAQSQIRCWARSMTSTTCHIVRGRRSSWMIGNGPGQVITPGDDDIQIHVELYDSGATRHISPYKSDFTSYAPLAPPIFLNTTNQQRFPAIGRGTLVVQVPNSGTELELTLHGALHALLPSSSY